MKKTKFKISLFVLWVAITLGNELIAQVIPLDTAHWDVQARAHVFENYKGKQAIYLQGGVITLKDASFLNGTIEFDIYLKEEQAFPGIFFRQQEDTGDAEQFYLRPHQSGNPDATQAAPTTRGITPWQLYFGTRYSFPYEYAYDRWTHVKLVVLDDKAQVFLDGAEEANLSWNLFHPSKKGAILIQGGGRSGMHLANIQVSNDRPALVNFKPIEREAISGLIPSWQVSDMFEESLLNDPENTKAIIAKRKWQGSIKVEEGTAANISRIQTLRNGEPGNTVFAKVEITVEKDQLKLFEFGYSDRVVAILNGKPIYRGTNKWRSRDYRYLGTVGLFDAIYLDLKKGKNTLLMAVSEDFGGWLITGKISDKDGVKISD